MPGSAGITEITPEGTKDIHGDFGAYCYENFRHSLCHGWASGPTPWMSRHVLGVEVVSPTQAAAAEEAFRKVLTALAWVSAAFALYLVVTFWLGGELDEHQILIRIRHHPQHLLRVGLLALPNQMQQPVRGVSDLAVPGGKMPLIPVP